MNAEREYYEQQGLEALAAGRTIDCSEPSITNVVIRLARLYLAKARTILDLGCGANLEYDKVLADLGKNPVCADLSFNFLRLAPRDSRMCLLQADATLLPFPDSSFDAVICSETIEHVPRDDRVIVEIARVLRPGGVLLITAPNLWNAARLLQMAKSGDLSVRMMPGHLREYTPKKLRNLLGSHFRLERWAPVPFSWTGKLGGPIDYLIRIGILRRFSKSIAFVATLG